MEINRRLVLLRIAAALIVVVSVPAVVVISSLNDEAPLVVGQESPRTIETDRFVRVEDADATRAAELEARRSVDPVLVNDIEAQRQTITDVRGVFSLVRQARTPVEVPATGENAANDDGADTPPRTVTPRPEAQVQTLSEQVDAIGQDGLEDLVGLSDLQLQRVESDTLDVVQVLLRQGIREEEVDDVVTSQLPAELARQSFPGEIANTVVEPLVADVLRATVRVDAEQTAQLEQAAVDAVEPVVRTWEEGDTVVEAGDVVTEVQLRALEQLGEAGSAPGVTLLRALAAMLLITAVVALYLRRGEHQVFDDPGRLLVLASTVALSSVVLAGVKALADTFGTGWWFAYPVGGIVLLLSVLISPQVGMMSVLPLAGVALLMAPALPALAIFVVAVAVLAAPMAGGVTTRSGLRRASLRVALAAPVVAAVVALVFGPRDQFLIVILAAALGGTAGAGLLQGLLPTFESLFRLATVTALLDLADRNHPLLRELEEKALGSYNHSVMVASLTERCCRAIGANHLLGQVAALYHDIGKVRQPHFFIENQRGIANPHDELEPRVSAVIIQNHVKDGVELAERHRLPPDVVSCIGSHHGTMLVTYFYRRAVEQAGGEEEAVDAEHFRYKGHRPHSKEAAVLLLADCCEATTRAMAMDRGTLPSDQIERTVDKLLHDRVEDQQFDQCELTFVELRTVRDTLVDALTGIYHPRIAYPGQSSQQGGPGGATSGAAVAQRQAGAPTIEPAGGDATDPAEAAEDAEDAGDTRDGGDTGDAEEGRRGEGGADAA